MTLRRTIQRRAKRKRAKARAKSRPSGRTYPLSDVITKAALEQLSRNLLMANFFINRVYDKPEEQSGRAIAARARDEETGLSIRFIREFDIEREFPFKPLTDAECQCDDCKAERARRAHDPDLARRYD